MRLEARATDESGVPVCREILVAGPSDETSALNLLKTVGEDLAHHVLGSPDRRLTVTIELVGLEEKG